MSKLDGLYRLYNAIQDMIFVVDCTTFQILYANQSAQDTTGYSLAQCRTLTLPMLYPGLDQTRLQRDLVRLETQPQVRYEEQLRLRDGSLILSEIRINIGQIDNVKCLIALVFNLWNQQMVEQTLQGSRILYRSLMDAVPDLLFRIRRDGTYLDYKVPDSLGLPVPEPQNILGKKVAEVVPEHVARLAMPAIERAVSSGEIETIEYSIKEPDGLHYYEARFVPSAEQEVIAIVRDISHHKRTEAALRGSEEMTRALLNASGDVAILIDINWTVLAVNEPAAKRFGMSIDDLIGTCIFDLLPADVAAQRKVVADYVQQTGEAVVFEDTSRGARFVNNAFPIFDAEGKVCRLAVFARDVTEERLNQEILRRQRSLLEGVAGATNRLLVNPNFHAAMSEALEILGKALDITQVFIYECYLDPLTHKKTASYRFEWTNSQVCPETDASLLPNSKWGMLHLSDWHDKLSVGEVILNPFPASDDSGSLTSNSQSMRALLLVPVFVSAELWGCIGFDDRQVSRDWTEDEISVLRMMAASIGATIERQRTEIRLKHEREIAETLREVGTVLTSTLKLDEVLGRLLEQVKRVIPYDAANVMVIENGMARIVRTVGYEQFGAFAQQIEAVAFDITKAEFIQKIIQTRTPYLCSDTTIAADWIHIPGTEWLRSWMGTPIVVRGEVVGLFSLDSAQKGFYGPEHLALIAPFAQQAAIAVENAKLFADVEELEHVKSQMIRIASHDLQSPLTRIRIAIQRLEEQIDTWTTSAPSDLHRFAEYGDTLNIIRESILEMEQIITDILSLERIETSIHTSEPIHWCEIIERCVNALQSELKAKNHKLQVNCAPDLPAARGSSAQLEHAILNMIHNAIKYTPADGEIEVRVLLKMYGERPTVAVEVQDNGIGIPSDQQAMLFEPFYRVRQVGTDHIPGAGMGLSVVKAAVEYHKGRVYVDSAPGEGSLFGFWIPV